MLACAAGVARVRAMTTPFSVHTATVPSAIFEPPREHTAAAGASVLEHLVGRPAASFWRDVWEREPLHVRASAAPSKPAFGRLLQLAHIYSLLARGASDYAATRTPLANFHDVSLNKRLERDGLPWTGRWGAENETLGVETLKRGFNAGFSLLVNDVEARVAAVAAACSALESYTRILCNANLYLTPAGAQGFDAHYDWMDGLVVQLDGAKRWRLYPPLVALPRADLTRKPTAAELAALPAAAEVELREGDVLYLPRGTLHEASTPADRPEPPPDDRPQRRRARRRAGARLDELATAGRRRRPAAAWRRSPPGARIGGLSSWPARAAPGWRAPLADEAPSVEALITRDRAGRAPRARRKRGDAAARMARDARGLRARRAAAENGAAGRGGSRAGSGRRRARPPPRWSSGRCGSRARGGGRGGARRRRRAVHLG